MTTGATFLAVSDIRGDIQYLASVLELAVRKDVGAQAVFINGNFAGQVITPEEREEYQKARTILLKELNDRADFYKKLQVADVTQLGYHMTMNPANYRRQAENAALRTVRVMVGLKDTNGRFVEVGRAGMRARRVYSDAEKLFRKCPIPVYVTGDTLFAEDSIDRSRWLHFAWFSFAGYTVRALTSLDGDESTGVPELAMGVRSGGKSVSLDEYPLASGDLIFAQSLNPLLHETLAAVPGKLVVVCGDGSVDLSYPNTILSAQKPLTAYLYRSEGARFIRRSYRHNAGAWVETGQDDVAAARILLGRESEARRRELDEQARLASFGIELVRFIDFIRAENPALAAQIEKSNSRVDAIMTYVRELEAQRTRLLDVISTQRAGLERVARTLEPTLGEDRMRKIIEVLNLPPASQTDVTAIDAANLEVARIIGEAIIPASEKSPTPQ